MAEPRKLLPGLDTPLESRVRLLPVFTPNPDAFGRFAERFARYMGTPQFLVYMTLFCILWLGWNTLAPEEWQFDPKALNYTLLTLILSLQASYAAPLILLAQNRQDDRDRVQIEQDRSRNERNLADTEYLTRELASLRLSMRDVATRDFVRAELRTELRSILDELGERDASGSAPTKRRKDKKDRNRGQEPSADAQETPQGADLEPAESSRQSGERPDEQ
ncbi:DUF1003 domain-containing protein [Sinomonas sp. JGH33]|uniref:DUF1003 domain-containing protein n=1 Tax=Sinomonas terricola TaxID=3110330 RepID=A0ABU5T1X5_9MICC|nr:DUF1003 domain-containing protein [Sinomonas sp. JGH33]MEA5453186.1 DUF1003 domain-containing protein [Sinomonas sp. JGH33]